ncbi:OmpA family protein [Kineococcus radiotolerans]|uniref:OmpA family protein n=1 Tax=Kineococcus radiotolerans TaxID=131568 RepID=UPI00003A3EA8|nr:OmpA family protein [Kineococcus radiotolerans]
MRAAAAALTAVLVTAGCTGGGGGVLPSTPTSTGTGTGATSAETTSSGAGEPAVVRAAPLDGGVLQLGLHPLVRVGGPAAVGDLVVLTLDLTVEEAPDDGEISLGDLFRDPVGDRTPMGGVRLLDLRADVAHSVALDTAGDGVLTEGYSGLGGVRPGETVRLQAAYAAPPAGTPDVAVLLPGTGLVEALAVVDGELPGPTPDLTPDASTGTGTGTAEDGPAPLDPDGAATAAVRPLEVYAEDLQGTVRTETSDAGARVALAADVLFALDSAELSPEARAVLETAATDVLTRRPGPVAVVGHTDDQGADDYNLDLSRRRAQAVADVLGPLLGADYPLQVDGRGEAEPAVPGPSTEARARNRRVELVVSTPSTGAALGRRTGEVLPARRPSRPVRRGWSSSRRPAGRSACAPRRLAGCRGTSWWTWRSPRCRRRPARRACRRPRTSSAPSATPATSR